MTKMLFIQSEDYWGYDASSFDDAINFYKFAWVVPSSQYKSMSEDDQKRLYPCALFYVAGVTDNHNFLTLKIVYDSTEAKVSGMEGTKRRTRRYEIGSNAQYSVGSYSLQAAPTSATTISEIKEAVESGSTSEGSFLISGFLDDAASVAKQVNYTEEKSAESFSAPITEPSGSSYEPADPTVANPSTEGPSESELITMSAEIEYAELGDESYPIVPNTTGQDSSFNGHGVPQWYGAEGSGDIDHDRIDREEEREVIFRYDHPMTFYDWSVDGDVTDEQIDEIRDGIYDNVGSGPEEGDDDFDVTLEDGRDTYVQTQTQYGDSRFYGLAAEAEGDSRLRDIRGKFMNRRKAKNAVFGEVMSQQMGGYYRTGIVGNNPPVGQDISRRNPVAKAKYFVQPGVQNANSGAWSKGPNFQQARKIAKGVAWDTVQDMGLAAEMFGSETTSFCADCGTTKKYRGEEEGCGCGSMSAETFNAELSNNPADYIFNRDNELEQEIEGLQKEIDYLIDKRPRTEVDGEKVRHLNRMVQEKYEERKALDKVHLGAEMEYAELGEELYPVVPNSEGGNTALDSGYGVPQWYGSAESDGTEDAPEEDYEFVEKADYYGSGTNLQVDDYLRAIAPKANKHFDFYANEWEDASWANLPEMTEDEYDACYFDFKKGGVFDGSDNMIVSMDDFAEAILNYDIVNIHGNYNWTDNVSTMDAQSITETLEEASPAKGTLVAPVIAALAGIVAGVFYARRS
ncbi:hypothetical protein N9M03_00475 [bacterium]|nr:hypothetical protein [bacterium]